MNTAPSFGFLVPTPSTGVGNDDWTSAGQPPHAPAAFTGPNDAPQAPAAPQALAGLHLNSLSAQMLQWQLAAFPRPAMPCESQSSSPPDGLQPEPRPPAPGLNLLANAALNSQTVQPGFAQDPLTVEVQSHCRPATPQPLSLIDRETLESYLESTHVSAAHLLAHQGSTPQLIEMLLHSPDELHAQDAAGNTPLHAACRNGHPTTALALVSLGAHPGVVNKSGITPLHLAAEHPEPELVKLLIDHGAHPNSTNLMGNTPLHWAAFRGQIEVMAALLNRGAAVERPNAHGGTALHAAAGQGHLEAVKLLLNAGANPGAQMKLPSGHLATPRDLTHSPAMRDFLFRAQVGLDALLDEIDPMKMS